MEYLFALNEQQREAVTYGEGPLLVLAGAGSGKTRVITYRCAYLIEGMGVDPDRLLAVTFTNKAAGEMRQRMERLLGENSLTGVPLISTFHSLCVRILRRHIEHLAAGFTRDFSIYDDDDQQRVIRQCMRDLAIDERQVTPRYVSALISHAKNHAADALAYLSEGQHARDLRRSALAAIYPEYAKRLRASNALDFDDLLIKTVILLRDQAEVRAHYAGRFHYLLVDEYQDTNRPQFNLIRLLTDQYQNLCVVGDPDQSIYRFRGADIQNIIEFESHYPAARVITLDLNYRSSQRILQVANAVIRNNRQRKEKSLRTENAVGQLISYYHAPTGEDEARFVVRGIETSLRQESEARIAVLYRTNAQSRLFEEECRRAGISFNMVGGFSFYKRAEIRDILAYLKLALNNWDDESLLRIINAPSRGIGKKTIDQLIEAARGRGISLWEALALLLAERMLGARSLHPMAEFQAMIAALNERAREASVSQMVRAAMEETGYAQALRDKKTTDLNPEESEGRLQNLEELLTAAVEAEERRESLREFIDHAALVSDADDYDPDAHVTLMTMHSAKGLEFPSVCLVGLEEGLFPHARAAGDPDEMEEERRLCYVAITRAQQQLFLSHARVRRVRGTEAPAEPSRFLQEIPEELLADVSQAGSWLSESRRGMGRTDLTRSEYDRPEVFNKPRRPFAGKTYNSVAGIRAFLDSKGVKAPSSDEAPEIRAYKTSTKHRFTPGMRVRHQEYGQGVVIGREGAGEMVKLTVRFPGIGDKKMIEKFAELKRE